MTARRTLMALALILAAYTSPAFAAVDCRGDLALPILTAEQFWKLDTPAMVEVNGKSYPITLSFDSEVEDDSLPKWEGEVPGTIGVLSRLYQGQRTVAQIAAKLQMSEAQVRSFVLAPKYRGTTISPEQVFEYSDVLPGYAGSIFDAGTDLRRIVFMNQISKLWNDYLAGTSLPFKTHVDGWMLEFTHESYEAVPAKFKKLISQLRSMFKRTHTHFHIGIPSEIGRPKTLAIARAVEAKLVLAVARNWNDYTHTIPFRDGTVLANEAVEVRGMITYNHSEWSVPHPTADIEVRQWIGLNEAYGTLAMAAALAQNHGRLRLVSDMPKPNYLAHDRSAGNVPGALHFISEILQQSADPADQDIAKELRRLSSETLHLNKMWGAQERALKKETADFLTRHKIYQRLTPEFFLLP